MPRCQFVRLDRVTMIDPYQLRRVVHLGRILGSVVAESVRKRREQGDLAGAWDDLMVMFRMARHLSGPVPIGETYMGLEYRDAARWAWRWSGRPTRRQTPERLRAALDAYRALPPMPPLIETIRAESILVENTLNLPADELSTVIAGHIARGATEFEKSASDVHLAAITSPWEVAAQVRAVGREPEGEAPALGRREALDPAAAAQAADGRAPSRPPAGPAYACPGWSRASRSPRSPPTRGRCARSSTATSAAWPPSSAGAGTGC